MIFINTRPVERGVALSTALQTARDDIQVISLPLLATIPLPTQQINKNYFYNLSNAKNFYKILIVISPTSAKLGLQYLQQLQIKITDSTKVIAVGDATAKILTEKNIIPQIPQISNNEGMLAMDCIKNLIQGDKVLIWRGQGGRKLLIETLKKKGVQVDILELYQRKLPKQANLLYQQFLIKFNQLKKPIATVLISSDESFHNWQFLVKQANKNNPNAPILSDFYYLVLGERLANILEKYQLNYTQLNDLHPKTILQKLGNGEKFL
ncbi:MAG: uroporphyrinogen-III synthase [Moraxellaceae bacterium]|nr:uroporphyrinogen-III synthase [Moraxellaceae bacterium]